MLQSLSIRNFVLIDELTIQFTPHFSVITGETGAGKSILLGAIALLMGQRADSSTIRPGAERCVIEARFTHLDAAVGAMLEEEDIDSDEEECIVRREITAKGKSRAFVNDTPASLQLLKRLSEYLIDIHSQHKNLLLGDAGFQLSVLDLYSGELPLLSEYQAAFRAFRSEQRAYEEACQEAEELRREQDYLQFQYDQLEEAEVESGELESLEEEERQLSHAQEIREELSSAASALEDDEHGALPALYHALRSVERIRSSHPPAGGGTGGTTPQTTWEGRLWNGHVVALVQNIVGSEADFLLISRAQWDPVASAYSETASDEAAQYAAGYKEGELAEWHIPTRQEATALAAFWRGEKLKIINATLRGASEPELYDKVEGRSVPYLCDEARSVFSFLENSHVRKAGKSVGTYLLRLVKTVHVRFQP